MKTTRLKRFGSPNSLKKRISDFSKNYVILIATILLGVIFSITSPFFLKIDNLVNILLQSATISIVAIGQAFVLLAGDFDLSVGQNVCLTSCFTAYMMKSVDMPPFAAIMMGLLLGTSIGLINGVLIAYARIPSFIATLGLQNICRGVSKIITNGATIQMLPKEISFLGRGYVMGIPVCAIIMLVMYVIAAFVSRKTKLGRYIYAIGGSSEAAFFAGIDIRIYKLITYCIAGFTAAVSAIILISRLDSASVTNGNAYEFDAIIGCVLGGISLSGGKGRIVQALFGTVFLILFFNGMTMMNINSFYQDVLKGIVLIIAIGIDVVRNRAKA